MTYATPDQLEHLWPRLAAVVGWADIKAGRWEYMGPALAAWEPDRKHAFRMRADGTPRTQPPFPAWRNCKTGNHHCVLSGADANPGAE